MQMDLWTDGLFVVPLTGQRKREGRGRVGARARKRRAIYLSAAGAGDFTFSRRFRVEWSRFGMVTPVRTVSIQEDFRSAATLPVSVSRARLQVASAITLSSKVRGCSCLDTGNTSVLASPLEKGQDSPVCTVTVFGAKLLGMAARNATKSTWRRGKASVVFCFANNRRGSSTRWRRGEEEQSSLLDSGECKDDLNGAPWTLNLCYPLPRVSPDGIDRYPSERSDPTEPISLELNPPDCRALCSQTPSHRPISLRFLLPANFLRYHT
jgi:hypothetical protein